MKKIKIINIILLILLLVMTIILLQTSLQNIQMKNLDKNKISELEDTIKSNEN